MVATEILLGCVYLIFAGLNLECICDFRMSGEQYFSQVGQDRYLDKTVFHGLRGGVFVDVGAHDGETISNTAFFEKHRDWTGVCVEARKEMAKKCREARPASAVVECAVANREGEMEFLACEGYTDMLSGLAEMMPTQTKNRIDREQKTHGGSVEKSKVQVCRLADILEGVSIKRVHYLSVDVQGAEFEVLQSLDFDEVQVDVVNFAANYPDTVGHIIEYMEAKGFERVFYDHPHQQYEVFMIRADSEFRENARGPALNGQTGPMGV
jgi:FkbM family methyltransferase